MDARVKNTFVEFEFCDGSKTELTLAFYILYRLKAVNPKLYERYMKIMAKPQTDELETITLLYTAYVCAHMGEDVMTEEEFMILCGTDRRKVNEAAIGLTQPKKLQASAMRSGNAQNA